MNFVDGTNELKADAATTVDASIVNEASTFDEAAIREHIALVHKAAEGAEGVLVLCAYGENPSTGGKETFPVEKFAIGDVDRMVETILLYRERRHANVYLGMHV